MSGGGPATLSQDPKTSQNLVGWEQAQLCSLSSAQAKLDAAEDPRPTAKTGLDQKADFSYLS